MIFASRFSFCRWILVVFAGCFPIGAVAVGAGDERGVSSETKEHVGTVKFVPATGTLPVPVPFSLGTHEFDYRLEFQPNQHFGLREYLLTFPSPVVTPQQANNTVHCEYFEPLGDGKHPGVVVLHILGGDFPLSRLCCRTLAANGVGALFVKMPYYGPRRAPSDRTRMISADLPLTVKSMQQAVQDIQCGAAWLAARPEIDSDRLGITGISLGGIMAALAAETDPRFGHVCLVLAGGHFGRVAWESAELSEAKEKWVADGLTAEAIADVIRPVDPVTYAENLRSREVLMINAKRDEVIPRACTEALWRGAGEPRIIWWNATHYSAAWHLPSGLSTMSEFFRTSK
jgi:dienelactone hydrolase